MSATPPICDFDWPAPPFSLPATDGKTYSFDDIAGPNGTLVMFICNHCPYVLAIVDKIIRIIEIIIGSRTDGGRRIGRISVTR